VVDPLLEALTRALLEKKPDARPRDANQVRELLELIETDRDAAAARLGVVPKEPANTPTIAMWKLSRDPAAALPPVQHPATISMWKLSRDLVPPAVPAPAPPVITRIPAQLPTVQRVRARFAGSGTKLPTEAIAPVSAKPAWPWLAIAIGVVLVVILALAVRG
jgi:hypothetical protein